MRRYLKVLGLAAALLLAPVFIVNAVHAADFRSGNTASVGKSEKIGSTLFIAGQNVDIAGEVDGDVFCAGNSITVTGTVHGDVLCAGQVVDIRGTVDGDVRVAGQTVTVAAKVAGNVSAAGQAVTFAADATARDVHAAGSTVTLNGPVGRDADVAGDAVTVNSSVGRNVMAAGENVTLGAGAKVGGDFTYTSRNNVSKAGDAAVVGKTRHDIPQEQASKRDAMTQFFSSFKLFVAITMLITSLVLVALAPRLFYSVSGRGISQPLLSAVSGVGVSIVGMVIVFLLAFTFIGLPLALMALLAWLLLLMLSVPVFSFYLGRLMLANRTNNLFYYMLAGAAVVFVVSLIPVLGALLMLVAVWFGTGMTVLEVFRRWPNPQYTLKTTRKKA